VYHSAPLAEETEFAGSPHLKVFISIDTPDTDFEVALYEILPDGRSVRLGSDVRRARFRETTEKEVFLKPGDVLPYDFDFPFFARRLAKGSRVRLVLRAPNSIFLEKNYNSGGDVADETAAVARTAHVRVYHDREHASVLTLPIGR
jgi:putative CocE/NonD family hydrolase